MLRIRTSIAEIQESCNLQSYAEYQITSDMLEDDKTPIKDARSKDAVIKTLNPKPKPETLNPKLFYPKKKLQWPREDLGLGPMGGMPGTGPRRRLAF